MVSGSTDNHFEGWVWKDNELIDRDAAVIAYVVADVMTIGQTRLLIEHTLGTSKFRMRATSPEGAYGTLYQTGLTVHTLHANCQGREYRLERNGFFGRERTVYQTADSQVAIRTRISADGTLTVEDGDIDIPVLDAVFLTWGAANIDAPRRTMRI